MSDYTTIARQTHERIRNAFLEEWDPIGVRNVPEAQDEYDAYVAAVFQLLTQESGPDKIFDYLWWVETVHMGLRGDRQKTFRFAERLARLAPDVTSHEKDVN